jgi:hypothetical protein
MILLAAESGWVQGLLQLLKAGLAARLEAEGHCVTIRPVELSAACRATAVASTFELAAAVARGVAETVEIGALPLVLSGNCGPAALGCIGGLQGQTKIFWRFQCAADHSKGFSGRYGSSRSAGTVLGTTRECDTRLQSVPERNVTAIGVRDLDEEEATAFRASDIRRVEVQSLRADLPKTLAKQRDIANRRPTSI